VNATGRQPVVFVHGLWLLPNGWDRWATLFEERLCGSDAGMAG
jgi:non-heme chloroperoxidase